MEIIIKGEAKEIAALLLEIAGRQNGEEIKNETMTALAEGLRGYVKRAAAHTPEAHE